jgi:hypothetical protein
VEAKLHLGLLFFGPEMVPLDKLQHVKFSFVKKVAKKVEILLKEN